MADKRIKVKGNLTTVGRFSSQLLAQRGAQKTVRIVGDQLSNTFKENKGGEFFPPPDGQALGNDNLTVGSISPDMYSAVFGYFISRGAGTTNANTMALLTIDTAKLTDRNPIELLENEFPGQVSFSDTTYDIQNVLRSTSDQLGTATDVNNRKSTQARAIRP